MYAVNPTYLIIKPKDSADIKVVYMRKDTDEPTDISKHKFKIEAVVTDESSLQLDEIKQYFEDLISSGKKVKGNSIKKRVYHKFEDIARNQNVNTSEVNKAASVNSQVKKETKPETPEEEPLR